MKQSEAHAPPRHTPPGQVVSSGSLLHVAVEVAGVQTWHTLAGSTVPAA